MGENGINIIHDIVNEHGTFLLPEEIELKFNTTCNALKYNTLKDAIPAQWRQTLKTMKVPRAAISFQEILSLQVNKNQKSIHSITNKDIYWILVTNKQKKPNITETSWNDLEISENQWKEIFTIPGLIRNTKLNRSNINCYITYYPATYTYTELKEAIQINAMTAIYLTTLHTISSNVTN